jgi:N-acetylglucosaminyl-diphospho-decaprenol L-rhamnosyltransferase
MRPELSIALVLYNSADELEECLTAIRPLADSGWAELIAVDNASPDRSLEVLLDRAPAARLVRMTANRGFAAGANVALSHARGRYWLLLNPDVRIPDGSLKELVRWMDAHPQVGAASPDIYAADGHWESPGRAAPSIVRTTVELLRIHRLLPARLRGRLLRGPYWAGGDQVDAGWIPGTAMIVRPDAVHDVGVLREDFFMYGEDVEWCWRMRHAGWKVGVCSRVRLCHSSSASARRTWSDSETARRTAAGIDAACRVMYGACHASVLAVVTALACWLEASAPRRDAGHRTRARDHARIWLALAKDR